MARRHDDNSEPNHQDRWMISYADFITLLFAFFVVMYAISSLHEGKYRVLSSSISDAFRSGSLITPTLPSGSANTMIAVPKSKPIAKAVQGKFSISDPNRAKGLTQQLAKVLDPLVKSGEVSITQTSKGIAIDIRDSALFAQGQAQPNPNSQQLMARLAQELTTITDRIRVEGFTDNVPIRNSTFPSNWELSAARAGSVVRLFEESGIDPDRMIAVAHGENRPIASNEAAEGRAQNRRVLITILAQNQVEHELFSAQ